MAEIHEYDIVVVGGGTAGSVIASRLTRNPALEVALVEGGPDDAGREEVRALRSWPGLIGGELDYDYPAQGVATGRYARGRVLGGCSSHGPLIGFRPLPADWDEWEAHGAHGWGAAAMSPFHERLLARVAPVHARDRNAIARDFVTASRAATGVPGVEGFNRVPFTEGAGFFDLAYDPGEGARCSASAAYLHPFPRRSNLHLMLRSWAVRLEIVGGRATGVLVRRADGSELLMRARRELVLCAGAVDTPRLLLHSGVGPAAHLADLGIPLVHDLPGVGENLLDHPAATLVWRTRGPVPPDSAADCDAGLFLRRADPAGAGAAAVPGLMVRFQQAAPLPGGSAPHGPLPEHGAAMTVSVPKPRGRGRLSLVSPDPAVPPALGFRCLDDDRDVAALVDGVRVARRTAATDPLARWLAEEVSPGPSTDGDEELAAWVRKAGHTLLHAAGTCRMGDADDPLAVVDPWLRVRGVAHLRIADASVFPTLPAVDPLIAVLMVGERAAALLGWGGPDTLGRREEVVSR